MLDSDPLRAWYGEAHVLKAAERAAVEKLLISDEIFRSALFPSLLSRLHRGLSLMPSSHRARSPSVARRKRFVKLVEDVKGYGGEVLIFSSMHESGQRTLFFVFLPGSGPPSSVLISRPTLVSRAQRLDWHRGALVVPVGHRGRL